uniref:Uncharacterized protein n=1 Tax=Xiphophorus maculatus TaxID=8083 RepID=A0A3B5QRF4_XIPMA
MEVPRCCHASSVIDGKILVSGGYINNAYSRAVCAYDPSTDTWQDKNSLSTPRGWHCAASIGDRAYVIGGSQLGGRGERVDVLVVESYNPHSSQWSYCAPLHTGVSTAGISILNNKIYLLGGWNEGEKNDNLLSSLQTVFYHKGTFCKIIFTKFCKFWTPKIIFCGCPGIQALIVEQNKKT